MVQYAVIIRILWGTQIFVELFGFQVHVSGSCDKCCKGKKIEKVKWTIVSFKMTCYCHIISSVTLAFVRHLQICKLEFSNEHPHKQRETDYIGFWYMVTVKTFKSVSLRNYLCMDYKFIYLLYRCGGEPTEFDSNACTDRCTIFTFLKSTREMFVFVVVNIIVNTPQDTLNNDIHTPIHIIQKPMHCIQQKEVWFALAPPLWPHRAYDRNRRWKFLLFLCIQYVHGIVLVWYIIPHQACIPFHKLIHQTNEFKHQHMCYAYADIYIRPPLEKSM